MSYNEWLDIDMLEDYLDGKLDAKAMHQIEKLSLEDPFVAEALAGLSQSPKRSHSLSLLQKQLQQRVAQKPVEQKRWRITAHRLSIAATAAVLFITVSVLFLMRSDKHKDTVAKETKNIDVNITPEVAISKPSTKSAPAAPVVLGTAITEDKSIVIANNKAKKNLVSAKTPPAIADVPAVAEASVVAANVQQSASMKAEELFTETIAAKRSETERKELVRALPSKAAGVIANTNAIFSGKVYTKDGFPVPGASIRIQGRDISTTTDQNGDFKINADSSGRLAVTHLGYATKFVDASPKQILNIELEPNNTSLSETVITGGGIARKNAANIAFAQPEKGWEEYEKYLINNNQLIKQGVSSKEVILQFEVDKNGLPKQIKVTKSAGTEMDKEAIRLLENGPKWIVKGTIKGQLSIKF